MLYKRSSFIKLLITKYECEVTPLKGGKGGFKITNGSAHIYMWYDKKDRIDYEEIYMHYQKLYLSDMPSDSELEKAD
jgi:hypothetical protein